MARRIWAGVSAVVVAVMCLGCSGMLWVFFSGLGNMEKDTDDFSAAEQRRLLDRHFPVPVPASASDLRIRYQEFQDWRLDIAFTLPPGDFEAYVARLPPHPELPGSYEGRTWLPDGGFVADASSISVDPATRRVALHALSW